MMKFQDVVNEYEESDPYALAYTMENEFLYGSGGQPVNFQCVQRNYTGSGRWEEYWESIFKDTATGEYWHIEYGVPATEMQEGKDTSYSTPYFGS